MMDENILKRELIKQASVNEDDEELVNRLDKFNDLFRFEPKKTEQILAVKLE